MKRIVATLVLLLAACGGETTEPEVDSVGGYVEVVVQDRTTAEGVEDVDVRIDGGDVRRPTDEDGKVTFTGLTLGYFATVSIPSDQDTITVGSRRVVTLYTN